MSNSREQAEQALALLRDALQDSEARAAELGAELSKQRAPKSQIEQQVKVLEHRLETLQADSDQWQREATQLAEILENERARSRQLKRKLEVAESGPDKVGKKEVNYWRSRAEQFDADTKQYRQRIAELRKTINTAQAGAEDARLDDQIQARDAQLAEQAARIAALDAEVAERTRQIEVLTAGQHQATQDGQLAHEKLASLEGELRQERECTINLSEIANERRDQITELSEKLDEALERYEEAKWQLERASRFERLVIKRRKLIASLLKELRAKQKANTALKAGLDGLRKHKAKSEEQQQKLLVRVEDLSRELREARERLASERNASEAEEKLRKSADTISNLEDKINAQGQAIDKLEADLTAARAARQTTDNQSREISQLRSTLEFKEETIALLKSEVDALQRQAAPPVASETEDDDAESIWQQQQILIEDLQLEIDHLKAERLQWENAAADSETEDGTEVAAQIRHRDAQITDLRRQVKDQDREIAKLNQAIAGWQKKYEFLATDAPSAYQASSSEK